MVIKEKYSLRFSKIRNNDNSIFYSCVGNTNIEGSIILSHLLQTAASDEAETLLEEIEYAIVGKNDEEDYLFDQNSSTWIEFSANNAIVYDGGGIFKHQISLINLKQLLEEWIEFVK